MKNIKYLLLGMFISVLFPLVSNAAGLKLENVKSSENNSILYNIIYDSEGAEEFSVNIKVNKIDNPGINYELEVAEGIINQKDNDLSYTINVEDVPTSTVVATLKITNNTNEKVDVIPSILGTYTATLDSVKINGIKVESTTTTTTTKAVPNNNLSNLNISVGVMDKTFNKDIQEYNVTEIKDTINSITLTPTCETECIWNVMCPLGECSVTNPTKNARVSLQTGANKISVVVSSKDLSMNKTYILNVYRGEIKQKSPYLSDLKINDAEISPNFDSLTNDYSVTIGADIETLDLITTPEDPEANIVVKGNENLKIGETTVTVTSSDGANSQVYTILVTKEDVVDEPVSEEEIEKVPTKSVEKKKNNLWLIIGISIGTIIILVVVFIVIFKNKKKNNKNDKNKPSGGAKTSATELFKNPIEKENTESLNILDETRKQMNEEPKQDIDEALDDLMMTKRLELGDLGL